MEEMGRVVMPGPFLSTLLGGLAILEAGSTDQKKDWLPRLADGKVKAALAWTEPSARWDAAGGATPAQPAGGGWVLAGTQPFAPHPPLPPGPRRGGAPRRGQAGGAGPPPFPRAQG